MRKRNKIDATSARVGAALGAGMLRGALPSAPGYGARSNTGESVSDEALFLSKFDTEPRMYTGGEAVEDPVSVNDEITAGTLSAAGSTTRAVSPLTTFGSEYGSRFKGFVPGGYTATDAATIPLAPEARRAISGVSTVSGENAQTDAGDGLPDFRRGLDSFYSELRGAAIKNAATDKLGTAATIGSRLGRINDGGYVPISELREENESFYGGSIGDDNAEYRSSDENLNVTRTEDRAATYGNELELMIAPDMSSLVGGDEVRQSERTPAEEIYSFPDNTALVWMVTDDEIAKKIVPDFESKIEFPKWKGGLESMPDSTALSGHLSSYLNENSGAHEAHASDDGGESQNSLEPFGGVDEYPTIMLERQLRTESSASISYTERETPLEGDISERNSQSMTEEECTARSERIYSDHPEAMFNKILYEKYDELYRLYDVYGKTPENPIVADRVYGLESEIEAMSSEAVKKMKAVTENAEIIENGQRLRDEEDFDSTTAFAEEEILDELPSFEEYLDNL